VGGVGNEEKKNEPYENKNGASKNLQQLGKLNRKLEHCDLYTRGSRCRTISFHQPGPPNHRKQKFINPNSTTLDIQFRMAIITYRCTSLSLEFLG